jgi:hypothetical protein
MSAPANGQPEAAAPAIRDEDKVALAWRDIGNLRACGFHDQADVLEELLAAAQTFTHELAEAAAMAEGWKALYEQAKNNPTGGLG